MALYIISRYNHDIDWIKEYTDNPIIYDRSERPIDNAIVVPNLGTDISDKFKFIIDNYDNLPDVAIYTKANLFKYITKEEFNKVKDNKTFTPLLTQGHKTYMPVCYYKDGLYYEINNFWYLNELPHRKDKVEELKDMLGMRDREYNGFAPGSNYILTKEDIHKHPKEFYAKLKTYIDYEVYPGEAQMIERSMYNLWS